MVHGKAILFMFVFSASSLLSDTSRLCLKKYVSGKVTEHKFKEYLDLFLFLRFYNITRHYFRNPESCF